MKPNGEITAIVWDYDGTLADTRAKNLNVTRKIIARVTGSPGEALPALRSIAAYGAVQTKYANWRELYLGEYGLSAEQTEYAGSLWTEYQLQDNTPAPLFQGIAEVIQSLASYPHGIVSQNSSRSILRALSHSKLADQIRMVVGYEEVPVKKQKPEPEGFLMCIEALTQYRPGLVVYVGDHETDAACAAFTNKALQRNNREIRVLHVAACYSGNSIDTWQYTPDFSVDSPGEILTLIEQVKLNAERGSTTKLL